MKKSNETLANRKKKGEKEKKNRSARKFPALAEYPRIETARYSACLRDNTLDGCSTLLFSSPFTDLDIKRTKRREREKRGKKKESRPVRCRRLFETLEGVTAL